MSNVVAAIADQRTSVAKSGPYTKGDVTRIILPAVLLLTLCTCSPTRGIRPNDTQVVAQWFTGGHSAGVIDFAKSGLSNIRTERAIESACGNICFDDGNDVGSGTFNVYLYTQDVPATVRLLVSLENAGSIPPGLRIGVAKYKDSKRRDWTYEGVYPPTLEAFDLMNRNSK